MLPPLFSSDVVLETPPPPKMEGLAVAGLFAPPPKMGALDELPAVEAPPKMDPEEATPVLLPPKIEGEDEVAPAPVLGVPKMLVAGDEEELPPNIPLGVPDGPLKPKAGLGGPARME